MFWELYEKVTRAEGGVTTYKNQEREDGEEGERIRGLPHLERRREWVVENDPAAMFFKLLTSGALVCLNKP